jgi:hypothetical protein
MLAPHGGEPKSGHSVPTERALGTDLLVAFIAVVVVAFAVPALLAWHQHVWSESCVTELVASSQQRSPESAKPKTGETITFRGFEPNPQQYLYPTALFALAALLLRSSIVARATRLQTLTDRRAAAYACVLAPSIRWLHLYRLLPGTQYSRRIFSYAHHDVALASALWNDLLFLIFIYLVVLICRRWIAYAQDLARGATSTGETAINPVVWDPLGYGTPPAWWATSERSSIERAVLEVQTEFWNWVIASFAVGVAFLYFTFVYWDLVFSVRDSRYVPSALIVHGLWIGTWTAISAPLRQSWLNWRRLMLRLHLFPADGLKPEEIQRLWPISIWGRVGAVASTVVSLMVPIIQTALGKSS